jgi:hypothetical protein
LTVDEARALRLAAVYGGPGRGVKPASLESAVNRIRAAERRAGVRNA